MDNASASVLPPLRFILEIDIRKRLHRCGRGQQNTLLVPQQTMAAGSGGSSTAVLGIRERKTCFLKKIASQATATLLVSRSFSRSSGSSAIFAAIRLASSFVRSLERQNYSVFQAALTGGKYNSVTFRVSIVKNSARYESGSLYHRRSGALR